MDNSPTGKIQANIDQTRQRRETKRQGKLRRDKARQDKTRHDRRQPGNEASHYTLNAGGLKGYSGG